MEWDRPTLAQLVTRIETDLVSRLQITATTLRRAFVRIAARAFAGAAHELHGHLAWAARQAFVSTADEDNLVLHGAEVGVPRKVATYATGNVTLSGTNGVGIPAGTRLQRADGVLYDVTTGAAIASGTATVIVRALTAGADGNAAAGVALTLVSPIAGVNSNAAVASGGLTNGVDTEQVDNWRARILHRKRNPPQGGSLADFEAWALEVAGVTRAWVFSNYGGTGYVGITFVMDEEVSSIIPGAPKVAEVQAHIDDVSRRPVTAQVVVFAPTAVPLAFNITVVPDTPEVRAAVIAELDDLLLREGEPDSTLLISHIDASISGAAGETDHTLNAPTVDQNYTPAQIPTRGTVTFT